MNDTHGDGRISRAGSTVKNTGVLSSASVLQRCLHADILGKSPHNPLHTRGFMIRHGAGGGHAERERSLEGGHQRKRGAHD